MEESKGVQTREDREDREDDRDEWKKEWDATEAQYAPFLPALDEAVKNLPLLREIITSELLYSVKIYGGFMRFFFSHCFAHNRAPSILEILEYLQNSDIDIKVKSYFVYKYFHSIRKLVQNAKGSIVYLGDDYIHRRMDIMDCDSYDSTHSVYTGMYGIYLPLTHDGKQYTVRYEMYLSKSQCVGYEYDFDVNQLSVAYYSEKSSEKSPDESSEKVQKMGVSHHGSMSMVNHLRDRKFTPVFYGSEAYDTVKKMYRMKKMYRQNFTLDDKYRDTVKEKLMVCEAILGRLGRDGMNIHSSETTSAVDMGDTMIIPCSKGSVLHLDLPTFLNEMKEVYSALGFTAPISTPEQREKIDLSRYDE
jgi:hypothetical protein